MFQCSFCAIYAIARSSAYCQRIHNGRDSIQRNNIYDDGDEHWRSFSCMWLFAAGTSSHKHTNNSRVLVQPNIGEIELKPFSSLCRFHFPTPTTPNKNQQLTTLTHPLTIHNFTHHAQTPQSIIFHQEQERRRYKQQFSTKTNDEQQHHLSTYDE